MRYLLDTNALIAMQHSAHTQHLRATAWIKRLGSSSVLLTTPITELGFCRVSVSSGMQPDVASAQTALRKLKSSPARKFEFVPDTLDADAMPAYVKKSADLTDGHLLELARANNAKLATLDTGIPGATQIP